MLSIVTVIKNPGNALAITLNSLMEVKSRYHIELIIVDNFSDSSTKAILKEYQSLIDQYICENDSGIYDAMNKGLKLAKNKWLLFLNAGDTLGSGAEILFDRLQVSKYDNYDVLIGATSIKGELVRKNKTRRISLNTINFIRGTPFCHQSVYYKRCSIAEYNLDYPIVADRVSIYELVYMRHKKYKILENLILSNYEPGGFSSNLRNYLDDEKRFFTEYLNINPVVSEIIIRLKIWKSLIKI